MYAQIEEIILKTKKKFFSKRHGEHTSFFLGSGLEFNEIRQYTIDDDIRHINWKTTAKTKDLSVNIYYENKRLDITLIYLCSGSMNFGKTILKNDIVSIVFASLSYLAKESKDSIRAIFFNIKQKETIEDMYGKYLPHTLFEKIKNLQVENQRIDYRSLNETIIHTIQSRSILFMVGDFLSMPYLDDIANSYEIYILIIRDSLEENLSIQGDVVLEDTNSNLRYETQISSKTIQKYNEKMKLHDKALFLYFDKLGIRYTKIYTSDNPIDRLEEFFKKIGDGK
jgi:hypothetical protein